MKTPEEQLQWVANKIIELYPPASCARCIMNDPEDATCHMDHFFDWVKRRFSH